MRSALFVSLFVLACSSQPSRFADDAGNGSDSPSSRDAVPDTASSDVSPDIPVASDVPDTRPDMDFFGPGVPMDAPTRFTGAADPSRAPSLVYPEDGTIIPPNLAGLEVHFNPGTGNDLFEVSFAGFASVVRVYTRCTAAGGGCVLALDPPAFAAIVTASRGEGTVRIGVRAMAMSGGRFGASTTRALGISDTSLRGGIYYWNAASGNIIRYEFGLMGARPEVFLRGDPINCLGCHVLSRDGRRATVGRFIPGPARTSIVDIMTRMPIGAEYGANFQSFSPDNSRLIISDGNNLSLLDGATAMPVSGLSPTLGSMPDWSPDGSRVVFSRPAMPLPIGGVGSPGHNAPADLALLPYSGGMFRSAVTLVRASGENNYYPSFSPDGAWVLFNRSSGNSYDASDASLYLVSSDGRAPVHLAAADGSGALANSWPKWAPFRDTYQGDNVFWITFSSKREYGLRAPAGTAQLWMAAIRPGHADDPSAPAFWMPFQDLSTGNHIGQWTQSVLRQSCTTDMDCATGEMCVFISVGMACVGR